MPEKNLITNERFVYNNFFKENLLKTSINNKLPIAIWKLPQSSTHHIAINVSSSPEKTDFSFNKENSGFIIHPFNFPEDKSFFIHADLYYNSEINELIANKADLKTLAWKDKILSCNYSQYLPLGGLEQSGVEYFKDSLKEDFLRFVLQSITNIDSEELKKVVAGRYEKVSIPDNFLFCLVFERLCNKYPNAFISLIYHPEVGCWMGASPEILLNITPEKILKTTALAGTQKVGVNTNPCTISWSHKEIEEQALVSRYIINCFKSIRLREFEEDGPRSILSGDLAHLKTDFTIDLKNFENIELNTTLLQLLHPTSAVGGMPKAKALAFLNSHEGFNRGLYGGYLGPVNIENESNIYVNIRCARIFNDQLVLFAGAGITKDSIPEKEWYETEMKMQAIKTCIY